MEERGRLLGSIRNIEETSRSEASRDNSADLASYAETGTDNFSLETALNIASNESEWLQNIGDALRRIEDGSYGTCEMCEQPIPRKRLEFFPSAKYCVGCQSKLEKERGY
jgi:RNA polymerase-binding transcription factor DksA